MGVTGGGLDLCVAEELTDHREALAGRHGVGGKSMSKVVDPDVGRVEGWRGAP